MKKIIPLIGYYLGWIYPIIVNAYIVLDPYLHIKTKLGGPLDFGNDSIMGYMFYSLIFAVITFLIFFIHLICHNKTIKNWVTLLNLPLYFVSLIIVPIYENQYFISTISLLLSIGAVAYTTVVTVDTMENV